MSAPRDLDEWLAGATFGPPAFRYRECDPVDPCCRRDCDRCGDPNHIPDERDAPDDERSNRP